MGPVDQVFGNLGRRLVSRHSLEQEGAMPLPHTTASCFTAYLLPHVLFVSDAEERGRIARVCCLAWNIALFLHARERGQHIEDIEALPLSCLACSV